MDTKHCNNCDQDVPVDKMVKSSRNKDGLASECKACQSKKAAERYAEDTEFRDRKKRIREEHKRLVYDFLWNYLLVNPCVDCGNSDPRVLEFDHRDRTTKTCNVTEMLSWGMDSIKSEIEKCDVRCANCHKIRTQEQFGTWRSSYIPLTLTLVDEAAGGL